MRLQQEPGKSSRFERLPAAGDLLVAVAGGHAALLSSVAKDQQSGCERWFGWPSSVTLLWERDRGPVRDDRLRVS